MSGSPRAGTTRSEPVRAEAQTEAALDAVERIPHKRLVVHYMQPHHQFGYAKTDFDKDHLRQIDDDSEGPTGENVWNQKFMGDIDIARDDLWSIYVGNLSKWEGLGMTLVEAMAAKLPVIASNIPAVNKVVIDEYTGHFVSIR
jgi:glycosyltransferase involved in cell wall biosynthesis